jgi:hypothetical protein
MSFGKIAKPDKYVKPINWITFLNKMSLNTIVSDTIIKTPITSCKLDTLTYKKIDHCATMVLAMF